MREIKFRAWHKENKSMFYFDPQVLKRDPYQGAHLAALMCGDHGDVLMQFTGLKDKNGKEIYEGDIILHAKESNMTSECTMIGPYAIGWNDFESHFELLGAPVHGRLMYKAYEIIGNIHETPELLK